MYISKVIIAIAIGLLLGHDVAAQNDAKPDTWPESVWNAELASVDGSPPFRLADYGGQVLVIYTWAAWCGPCRLASPAINELSKEFAGRGVEVIGLVVGARESEAKDTLAFTKKFKHNFKSGLADDAMARAVMTDSSKDKEYNVIPQVLVITSYGYIQTRFIGFSKEETPRKLREAIESALANPSLTK